jgi:hypothetical protein
LESSNIGDQFKGIFISSITGEYYVKVFFDTSIRPELLSSFIAGLSMFGREAVGHIEEILIKGLNLDVFVVHKHNLILTAIFSSEMPKINIKAEAEQVLDIFIQKYGERLSDFNGCVDEFCEFETIIKNQIREYFDNIDIKKKKSLFQRILSILK